MKNIQRRFKDSGKIAHRLIMNKTPNIEVIQKYPWRGKFRTKIEIDDYLVGNKVQCLLCGKLFKVLTQHLERTHDITTDDYRERYSLPWRRGLCGVGTSKKLSKNMFERQKNGFRPPIEAAGKKAVGATKRQDQPFFVKVKLENMKIGTEKIKKYTKQDFQNVLAKMLNENKGLNEVCKDADMPHLRAVSKYAKKNADFRKDLFMLNRKPFSGSSLLSVQWRGYLSYLCQVWCIAPVVTGSVMGIVTPEITWFKT